MNELSESQTTEALPDSALHTFIDEDQALALSFLDGQRLIHDLALLHALRGGSFSWFRDAVLSIQPLIGLIKSGEQIGFYVDSEDPFFRLKIETGHAGDVRCTMRPEELEDVPQEVHGLVRIHTLFPEGREPHTSIIQAKGIPLGEIVNQTLAQSYQVTATVILSAKSDQSAMLHQLPALKNDDPADFGPKALARRVETLRSGLDDIFALALSDKIQLQEALAGIGFRWLASRPIQFRCGCTRDRMVANLKLVRDQNLFGPTDQELELTCDYCKTPYVITRREVEGPDDGRH